MWSRVRRHTYLCIVLAEPLNILTHIKSRRNYRVSEKGRETDVKVRVCVTFEGRTRVN